MDDGTIAMAVTELFMLLFFLVSLLVFAIIIGFGFSVGKKLARNIQAN